MQINFFFVPFAAVCDCAILYFVSKEFVAVTVARYFGSYNRNCVSFRLNWLNNFHLRFQIFRACKIQSIGGYYSREIILNGEEIQKKKRKEVPLEKDRVCEREWISSDNSKKVGVWKREKRREKKVIRRALRYKHWINCWSTTHHRRARSTWVYRNETRDKTHKRNIHKH